MKKIVFACDLDNTLLHSRKKYQETDICAEILNDVQQSFITPRTDELIMQITADEKVLLLPVTTRSIAQYKRIQWHEGCTPELALVCNGAILLRNGEPDPEWLEKSNAQIEPYRAELQQLCEKYTGNPAFKTVRIVDDMFLFLYCYDRDAVSELAESCRKDTQLHVEYSGSKMYIFPDPANKGASVRRFADTFGMERILAAGDSMIDISMLHLADTALVPDADLATKIGNPNHKICPEDKCFSDFIFEEVLGI